MSALLISSVQLLSRVRLFATPWTAARQASLSVTSSRSLLKLMSIESVMHPATSSSVVHFSSHLQSFPASGSFQMSQFFTLLILLLKIVCFLLGILIPSSCVQFLLWRFSPFLHPLFLMMMVMMVMIILNIVIL